MRPIALSRLFDEETLEAVSLLVDLPVDHVRAVWEQVRKHRAYRILWIERGRRRQIHAPTELLAEFQRRILTRLLHTGPVSPAAFAGVRGRSVVDAARRHLGQRGEVLTLDVADAFGSTAFRFVSAAFRQRLRPELRIMGLPAGERAKVASAIAHLVTVPARVGSGRTLPLGAPTSTAVFNLVFLPLDREILRLARDQDPGAIYTRYVDDLVVSTPNRFRSSLQAEVRAVVMKAGFTLNEAKTRLQTITTAEVYGLWRGPMGVEPAPPTRARCAAAIQACERLARSPSVPAETRARALARLRGIEGYLSQFYGRPGPPRPRNLFVSVSGSAADKGAGVRHPDELWG